MLKAEFIAGELRLTATLPAERDMLEHFFGTGFVHLRTKKIEDGKKMTVMLSPSTVEWNLIINVDAKEKGE